MFWSDYFSRGRNSKQCQLLTYKPLAVHNWRGTRGKRCLLSIIKLGLPLLQLLGGAKHVSVFTPSWGKSSHFWTCFFVVRMGYKKNWFLKGGWLSIFVELMWVILYIAANQQNAASQGESSSSKTCRVCLNAVTFQESWFVVAIENIWQLITFSGAPPFSFYFCGIAVLVTHCLSPNQSIFGHFLVIQSGLSGWMNRFWKPRRRCFFSRFAGGGRCSTFCGWKAWMVSVVFSLLRLVHFGSI